MLLAPGVTPSHYRLVEPIGEGRMGVVWRANDTTLSRDVAIKVRPDVFASDAERLARFEREAKLLASLNHPHICTLFDVGREGETFALVASRKPPPGDFASGPRPSDVGRRT